MAMIPDWFVEELLTRTDIVELIQSRLTLKKSGTNYSACCPFHNEKTPSFVVFGRNQNYHCFGCGAHGDAISFLRQSDGLGYVEALETLATRVGLPMPQVSETEKAQSTFKEDLQKAMNAANLFYQKMWKESPFAAIAGNYLKKRGLLGQTAKQYQIGLAPPERDALLKALSGTFSLETLLNAGLVLKNEAGELRDRFRARVLFPIRNRRGNVLGFGGRTLRPDGQPKYLNSPETPLFHKGHELYGLYEAMLHPIPSNGLLVVEGYMDVVMLSQHGIPQVVASLGTACTREQIRKLFKQTPHIIFCFDGDAAGKKAAERALLNVLPELEDGFTVHFLLLPAEHDPDSFVRARGKEAFLAEMAQATPLNDFLFDLAGRDLQLASADDKVIFIQRAQSYLQQIKPGLLQTLLTQALAERIEVAPELLAGQAVKTAEKSAISKGGVQRQEGRQPLSLVEQVVMMVLKEPTWASAVPEALLALLAPYETFIQHLKGNPTDDILSVIHHWPDLKVQPLLLALHRRPMTMSSHHRRAEFEGALKRLTQQQRILDTELLLKKASANLLDEAEKQRLSQLLREKTPSFEAEN